MECRNLSIGYLIVFFYILNGLVCFLSPCVSALGCQVVQIIWVNMSKKYPYLFQDTRDKSNIFLYSNINQVREVLVRHPNPRTFTLSRVLIIKHMPIALQQYGVQSNKYRKPTEIVYSTIHLGLLNYWVYIVHIKWHLALLIYWVYI